MCIVEFTSHLLSDRDITSSTGMGAGVNGNNQWEWEGNGNKTRLNLGLEMGMGISHWEWEGMGLKKIFRLISSAWTSDMCENYIVYVNTPTQLLPAS